MVPGLHEQEAFMRIAFTSPLLYTNREIVFVRRELRHQHTTPRGETRLLSLQAKHDASDLKIMLLDVTVKMFLLTSVSSICVRGRISERQKQPFSA